MDGPVKIRLYDIYSKSKNPFDMDQRLFEWIKKINLFLKQNKKNILTHSDAMVAGKRSSRTTHRLLKEATRNGFLVKNGKGKKTYYQPNNG